MPSTAIRSYRYDPDGRMLDIVFTTGRHYRYAAVPPELVERFGAASSRGAFFNIHIRGHYEYEELGRS